MKIEGLSAEDVVDVELAVGFLGDEEDLLLVEVPEVRGVIGEQAPQHDGAVIGAAEATRHGEAVVAKAFEQGEVSGLPDVELTGGGHEQQGRDCGAEVAFVDATETEFRVEIEDGFICVEEKEVRGVRVEVQNVLHELPGKALSTTFGQRAHRGELNATERLAVDEDFQMGKGDIRQEAVAVGKGTGLVSRGPAPDFVPKFEIQCAENLGHEIEELAAEGKVAVVVVDQFHKRTRFENAGRLRRFR